MLFWIDILNFVHFLKTFFPSSPISISIFRSHHLANSTVVQAPCIKLSVCKVSRKSYQHPMIVTHLSLSLSAHVTRLHSLYPLFIFPLSLSLSSILPVFSIQLFFFISPSPSLFLISSRSHFSSICMSSSPKIQ